MSDLSVYLVTWNVEDWDGNRELPKFDLTQLLDIQLTDSGQELADLYVIALQEVSIKPQRIFSIDPWIESFDRVFMQLDYVRLKYIRVNGVLLIVYTRRQSLPKFRSIEAQYMATDYKGFSTRKGCVSVSLVVDGISLCLICSHLAADGYPGSFDHRITEYNNIINGQYFLSTRNPNILSHDYVIWLGDLNFRIDDLSSDEIHDIIVKVSQEETSNYSLILKKDQLSRVRREGRAFTEFEETEPRFAPTYKFFINTDNYDLSRKPAFTDRVLYRVKPNAHENFVLDMKQIEYKSHPHYKQSDHKPVSALFHIKTIQKPSLMSDIETPLIVTFRPITNWKVNHNSTAWYTITPGDVQSIARLSHWDWIGLYKSDFLSLEELKSFVWANPIPTRLTRPSVKTTVAQRQTTPTENTRLPELWFSVQFSYDSLQISDQFRLIYFAESGDVLGMSDPFVISL